MPDSEMPATPIIHRSETLPVIGNICSYCGVPWPCPEAFDVLQRDLQSLARSYLGILAWQQAGKDLRRAGAEVDEIARIAGVPYDGSWG